MTKNEQSEYAKKRYPQGSYYKDVSYGAHALGCHTHEFKFDSKGIYCGFGYIYDFKKKIWAENCDENGNIIPYTETEKIIDLW